MLGHPKYLPTNLSTLILRQHFHLRQLHAKSSHRYRNRDEEDGDFDNKFRKKTENQDGYLHFYKIRGQHILTNPRVLDSIVRKSEVRPSDTVLEIGPGTGNLTLKLLEVAKKVVAVEIDKRMVEVLHKRVSEGGLDNRLTVICNDALKTEFPPFDVVVANIPYGISSPLVAKFVFGANPFRSATLLLQKEFARRLLAKPGDSEFNRLAANVKLMADVEFVMEVSKMDFIPVPKVDSSVIKIRPKPVIPDVDLDEWLAFTRTCFSKKNKTLGATFKQKKKLVELLKLSKSASLSDQNYVHSDDGDEGEVEDVVGVSGRECSLSSESESVINSFRERIIRVLKASGYEDKRPSKLSNEELLQLLSLLNQAGICFHDQAKPEDPDHIAFTDCYG